MHLFYLIICRSWFNKKPPKTGQMVPIPPLKGDEWHNMTTIPYLMDHYYDLSENVEDEKFYTEHQLNGTYLSLQLLSHCRSSFAL